jgi:hypothetical protein
LNGCLYFRELSRMTIKFFLLAGSAILMEPTIVAAQDVTPLAPAMRPGQRATSSDARARAEQKGQQSSTTGEILVTGERKGSVRGDIPPENVLNRVDMRATGASDLKALLDVLAPQLGSARGRDEDPPVLLLDGQRVSSGRELRDIPTEAIARLEILPEDVALSYGYRADQRVVNIVLVDAFSSIAALIGGSAATDGGYADGTLNLTRLVIGNGARTTVNLYAQGNSLLAEDERNIWREGPLAPGNDELRAAKSLKGSKRDVRAALTHYRQFGGVGVSGNLEFSQNRGRALVGLDEIEIRPKVRDATENSLHAGIVANGNASRWSWSVTGNADVSRNIIDTDRNAAGRDRAVSNIRSGDIDLVIGGSLFAVPAGETGVTFRVGGSAIGLRITRRLNDVASSSSLRRTTSEGSISFNLPISRRRSGFAALGNLTLNGNARLERISDFGTLTTIGLGIYWSPMPSLSFIANWTREAGAPTVQQLGEATLETPLTGLFDATTGNTVLATIVTGGNPRLAADHRNVVKFSGNWKPFEDTDLRLRIDYVRTRFAHPISTVHGSTPAFETAFPGRFVRSPTGDLISADLRPVNFASARRDTVRMGIDLSVPVKSASRSTTKEPSANASRSEIVRAGLDAINDGAGPVRTLFGPDDGNRLWLSLTDTITLIDDAIIREGLRLDYLRGDAVGLAGGRSRHHVEGRAGYSVNGRGGAVLSANWRSGTRVTTATSRDVRFSSLATFDLGLFANLDPRFKFLAKHPWLEGASIHLEVKNLLNARSDARDRFGNVPLGFQSNVMDPVGRMIGITFRKGGGGAGG